MRSVLVAALLIATPVAAQEPTQSLKDVEWLVGEWRDANRDRVVTETWLAADGGVMPGVNRTIGDEGTATVEFMKLVEQDGALAFVAILSGQAPTIFPIKSLRPGEAVFENLAHDFPQRVIYRRCDVDLCAAIEGVLDDAATRIEWRFTRLR